MENPFPQITIQINPAVYIKDPQSSDLGKRIIASSIDMIDELGFEQFTFKKLARVIETSEASIYRYFESKHKLLLYITSWYWAWMDYRLSFKTANVTSAIKCLRSSIELITEQVEEDSDFSHINEVKLNNIVINESPKVFLNRSVDQVNKEGVFLGYKQLVDRISKFVLSINSNFRYPHMLISTIIEGAHLQRYFADHLPKLTDTIDGEDSVQTFYSDLVFKMISQK
ncbi:TetR/AcrR family transcriptional regulator [bacterium]|nr:TetR/AcrR family transcriptional regulator [bacterium]